jgi:hypothetical protein
MPTYTTRFGSLEGYVKGSIELIDDDPKRYAFSNVFDVAAHSRPYEKVCVAKNRQYVLEAIRAEGDSEWRAAAHDEFALVMDGEVEVRLRRPAPEQLAAGETQGSVRLDGEPGGPSMGRIVVRRGHMALRPAGAAYQFHADRPGVLLLQTQAGEGTVYRWAEICRTH